MIQNNKCILVYGLNDDEIIKIKQRYARVIKITNDMGNVKVNDVVKGLKISSESQDMPNEQMILFNGLSEGELKGAIKYIRSFISGSILAVITPTSAQWSFKYLLEHLIEEREWFKTQQKGRE